MKKHILMTMTIAALTALLLMMTGMASFASEESLLAEGEEDPDLNVVRGEITYLNENKEERMLSGYEYQVLGKDVDPETTGLTNGYYVVSDDLTVNNRVQVTGDDVRLILTSDKTLTCSQGIHLAPGSRLIIYDQDPDRHGRLYAYGTRHNAGIGADESDRSKEEFYTSGDLVVCGGEITAAGGDQAAGIGGASGSYSVASHRVTGGDSGTFTMFDGTVYATGGKYGAGVGGGYSGHGGVTAVYGGHLEARAGEGAAGIGGGYADWFEHGHCGGTAGEIQIGGGIVNAYGGKRGAGIGAGQGANATEPDKWIRIYGGEVKAIGGEGAAGIGGAYGNYQWYKYENGAGGNLEITGGKVHAEGGDGAAGIGSSRSEEEGCGETIISGGTVEAYGGEYAAGIGTGNVPVKPASNAKFPRLYNIKISGDAVVNAYGGKEGAGIGTGNEGKDCSGEIEISDRAVVTAQGGKYGAGIGGGDQTGHGTIRIGGDTVNATGGQGGAGIGGGDDSSMASGKVYITKGRVNATGGEFAAGIGAGDEADMLCSLKVTGGMIRAIGGREAAGIGGGNHTFLGGGGSGGNVDVTFQEGDAESYLYAVAGHPSSSAIGHGDDASDVGTLALGPKQSVKADHEYREISFEGLVGLAPVSHEARTEYCFRRQAALIQRCFHAEMDCSYVDSEYHSLHCRSCNVLWLEQHQKGDADTCMSCKKPVSFEAGIGTQLKVTTSSKAAAGGKKVRWTIRWTGPDHGGADDNVKKYRVAYRKVGEEELATVITDGTSLVVSNADAGGLYEYLIAEVGEDNSNQIWNSHGYSYLGNVRASAKAGKKSVRVNWKADRTATSYRVMISTKKNMKKARTVKVGRSGKSHTFKGLKKGRTYYVRVCPVRKYGGTEYKGIMSRIVKVKVRR